MALGTLNSITFHGGEKEPFRVDVVESQGDIEVEFQRAAASALVFLSDWRPGGDRFPISRFPPLSEGLWRVKVESRDNPGLSATVLVDSYRSMEFHCPVGSVDIDDQSRIRWTNQKGRNHQVWDEHHGAIQTAFLEFYGQNTRLALHLERRVSKGQWSRRSRPESLDGTTLQERIERPQIRAYEVEGL